MANKLPGRRFPAQIRDRSKGSDSKRCSISAASTSEKKGKAPFQREGSDAFMSMRPSAERWNVVVRSGLVRSVSAAGSAASSASSASLATFPTARRSPDEPSSKSFAQVATLRALSSTTAADAPSLTHRQQRPLAEQQQIILSGTSRSAPGLQSSSPAAAESVNELHFPAEPAVIPRAFQQTEEASGALCTSGAEAEAAAAAAAFLRSNAAVPTQLLALLGALAGIPPSDPPTVCLSCHRWKKGDKSDSAVTSDKHHPIVSAPHAEDAFSTAHPAAHGDADAPRQNGQIQQEGEEQLTDIKHLVSRHRASTVADSIKESEKHLLPRRTRLEFTKAECVKAANTYHCTNEATAQCAAASINLTENSLHAAPFPSERSANRPSSGACNEEAVEEATPPDLFSAALWRLTGCRAVETVARPGNSAPYMPSLQRVNADHVFTTVKRRHGEQHDARFVAGSLQALLGAVHATASQTLKSPAYAPCPLNATELFIPDSTADQAHFHSEVTSDPSCTFCLPCAILKHHRHKLAIPSSSNSFAVANFILPCPKRHHCLTQPDVSAVRCQKEAAEGRRSNSNSACTKIRGDSCERTGTHCVKRVDATALPKYSEEMHCDCAAREVDCRGPCKGVLASSGYLAKCHGRTCRAVYTHLGMLYTAADIAASATAAAAGKAQRQAQTAAATMHATVRSDHFRSTGATSALGSVLLKRALSSSLVRPLRAQILLQNQHIQQAEQDISTLIASCTNPMHIYNVLGRSELFSSVERQAAIEPQHREITLIQPSCISVDGDDVREAPVLRPGTERNLLGEEERGTENENECDAGAEGTSSMILCCFDGIEQLQLCQWKQAVQVLDSVLSEVVRAAAIHVQQEKLIRAMSEKIACAERGSVCMHSKTVTDVNRTRLKPLTAQNRLIRARAVPTRATMDTPCPRNLTPVTGVLLLLLWKQSQLELGERVGGAPRVGIMSQKGLWKSVSSWQQQVQQAYPSVQVLVVLDADDMRAEAYLDMLRYLTKGSNLWRRKNILKHLTQQRLLPESGEEQEAQHVLKLNLPPQDQESESAAQYCKKGSAQACVLVHEDHILQDRRRQRQQTPPQGRPERLPDTMQCNTAQQHQNEKQNGDSSADTSRDAGMAQDASMSDRGKQSIHTDAATAGACVISMQELVTPESAAFEHRQVLVHDEHNRIRPHDVLKRAKKKVLRPCMLFLCGHSFMAAPLLSEGRSWRKMMSCIPTALQEFVRELEEHVYIPMKLRSRLVGGGASRGALHRATAASTHSTAVAASVEDRTKRLLRQCERLLRWGDELLPPPRVLVHSCDIKGECRWSASRGVSAPQRDSERTTTVPLDAGVSPQQLLQLVGEKYNEEVQTFLLPVAALASSFVGQTEEKLRRLLREAAAAAPAVLVLLGLESLAARRQIHHLPTYKQRTTHTVQQPACEKRTKNAVPVYQERNEKHELRRTGQTWETGFQYYPKDLCVQAQLRPARRIAGRECYAVKQVGKAKQDNQSTRRLFGFCINDPPPGDNMHTARRVDTSVSRDSEERTETIYAAECEINGDDEDTQEKMSGVDSRREDDDDGIEKEEPKFYCRKGTAATSSFRRRLLAALLVGLDDVEDRRSCSSTLLSADDPWHATAADETNNGVVVETKLARRRHLQQAGLAVVGVCGGYPDGLDEAVVRAGRLDVWLSWPQCIARKGRAAATDKLKVRTRRFGTRGAVFAT